MINVCADGRLLEPRSSRSTDSRSTLNVCIFQGGGESHIQLMMKNGCKDVGGWIRHPTCTLKYDVRVPRSMPSFTEIRNLIKITILSIAKLELSGELKQLK